MIQSIGKLVNNSKRLLALALIVGLALSAWQIQVALASGTEVVLEGDTVTRSTSLPGPIPAGCTGTRSATIFWGDGAVSDVLNTGGVATHEYDIDVDQQEFLIQGNSLLSYTCPQSAFIDENVTGLDPVIVLDDSATITICHNPGTPNENTLALQSHGALQGHLKHGDNLGACS